MNDKSNDVESRKYFYLDLSFWALIFTNLIVITSSLIQGWSLRLIMWFYWSQSVIIGIFWFFKILALKRFSTEGYQISDMPVKPTKSTKIQTAVFFLIHYNLFHFMFAFFLKSDSEPIDILPVMIVAAIFFVYQAFSFFYNRKWADKHKPNIGTMLFFPYARIIPMHVTLCVAAGDFIAKKYLILFLLLKTLADVIMHVVEKKCFGDISKIGVSIG